MQLEEKTIDVNGVTIYYVRYGHGEHIVFALPAVMCTARGDYVKMIELFDKDKYTLILWDPIGRGKSRFPDGRDFIFNNEFRDIEAHTAADFMEKLGIKRYSILGGCYAGQVALKIAATRKKCVNKVLIWGSRAYITEKECATIEKQVQKFINNEPTSEEGKAVRDRIVEANGDEEYAVNLAKAFAEGYWDSFRKNKGNMCMDVLPEVEAEVLVVHGENDSACPIEQATYLFEHLKGSKMYVFPNGSHGLHLRFPRELYELIDKFLQSPQ